MIATFVVEKKKERGGEKTGQCNVLNEVLQCVCLCVGKMYYRQTSKTDVCFKMSFAVMI